MTMTKTTANSQIADMGRDPVTRPGWRDGLAGIAGRISKKARWIISVAVGLITPAVLIAESGAAPIADAMACFGNGSFMALAATANAFTMIP
jgi:hypothetical protein